MRQVKIIEKKQRGEALSRDEIKDFIEQYVEGKIPDYQMSALLMAIYFQGMNLDETLSLTQVMLDSGARVDFSDVPNRCVDKHSTGGVGDKLSLIVAPTVAACGGYVPMISGRGLGHTGGTLDKLESIPGFEVNLSPDRIKSQTLSIGAALAGQDAELVPADKKIYSLRDVTATVRSLPLIASSIISKKAAEGVEALVLDVKIGEGAIFRNEKTSESLAKLLVQVGEGFGIKTIALLTDMSQPLGRTVGNWLEVRECVELMFSGEGSADLIELNRALSATMLKFSHVVSTFVEGMEKVDKVVLNRDSYRKFLEIVKTQSGDISVIEDLDKYPRPKIERELLSPVSGFVSNIEARLCGELCMELGAGRKKIDDKLDYSAGVTFFKKRAEFVKKGDILAIVSAESRARMESVWENITKIYHFHDYPPDAIPLIKKVIHSEGETSWEDFVKS